VYDVDEINRRMEGRWPEVFEPRLEKVKRRGDEWQACCPFHNDRNPSFSVNVKSGLWKCHAGCGGGNGFQFLQRADNLSFLDAVRMVAAMVGMDEPAGRKERRRTVPVVTPPPPKPEPVAKPELAERLQEYQAVLAGSPGEEYLKGRGISLALAQSLGVGYAAPGRWLGRGRCGRVVFPHTNPAGEVVNLYGRAVGEVLDNLKHDHLKGQKGMFNAAALLSEKCYITEGAFDAISFIAAGYPNAAAVFGVDGMRWEWLRARQVVLCLDADKTGQESWQKLALGGYTRGHEVSFADANTYGGFKDASEAWAKHGRLDLEPGAEPAVPITARGEGWELRYSKTLEEYVVFAKDEAAAAIAPAGYVTYTDKELQALGGGSLDTEGLRELHEAKKLLGARVGSLITNRKD
jgi:DNA primase